ncbi:MAG: YfhO family protein [Pirellulaceae bacterium]|nr:YfhO family protein [Pirellulaceae bacterium]
MHLVPKSNAVATAGAALLLALATLVCFHRLAAHPSDLLVGPHDQGRTDLTTLFAPTRAFQQQAVWQGKLPLWNARLLCGTPVAGNPQSGLFYPVNWLGVLPDALLAVSWLLVAHHWLAGLGTYLLARRWGAGFLPAVLAGVVFLTAPFLVAAAAEGHYNHNCAIAWLPWTLLGYERLRRGERFGIPGTALALALSFLCGHVQETYYVGLALALFLVADLAFRPPDVLVRPRLAQRGLIALGTTVGLVALELIPNWFYARQSVRSAGLTVAQAGEISVEPENLWQLLDPFALGLPETYQGDSWRYWEQLCYFGIVPLLLALVALATGWRRYPAARLGLLLVLALLIALGNHTPVFGIAYRLLPGLSLFRVPSRVLYLASFAIALLAGIGLDQLLALARGLTAGRRRSVGWIAGAGAAGLLLLGAAFWLAPGDWQAAINPAPATFQPVWALGLATCGLALGATLLLQPRWATWVAAAMLLVCLADATRHSRAATRTATLNQPDQRRQLAQWLVERAGDSRVLVPQDLVSDREAGQAGLNKVAGYEGVPLLRTAVTVAGLVQGPQPESQLLGFAPLDLRAYPPVLLDLLGVRLAAIVTDEPPEIDGWALVSQGRQPVEFALRGAEPRSLPWAFYERREPLPRAFVLGTVRQRQRRGPVEEQLRRLDPRREVLIEEDLLDPGPRQMWHAARVVYDGNNQVRVLAELEASGYLVLSDTYYPGWTASAAGQQLPVVPANFAFRAVPLSAGRHEVQFDYEPPGLKVGLLVSGLTLFWLVLLSLRDSGPTQRSGRRQQQPESAVPEVETVSS